jgi:hypothetical protein
MTNLNDRRMVGDRMKAGINPPSTAVDANSYQLECQFALEPSLTGLTAKAQQAGWDDFHILAAIISYASMRITSLENDDIQERPEDTH